MKPKINKKTDIATPLIISLLGSSKFCVPPVTAVHEWPGTHRYYLTNEHEAESGADTATT